MDSDTRELIPRWEGIAALAVTAFRTARSNQLRMVRVFEKTIGPRILKMFFEVSRDKMAWHVRISNTDGGGMVPPCKEFEAGDFVDAAEYLTVQEEKLTGSYNQTQELLDKFR